MAFTVYRHEAANWARTVDVEYDPDVDGSNAVKAELEVPTGAIALALALSQGDQALQQLPEGVRVRLLNPEGKEPWGPGDRDDDHLYVSQSENGPAVVIHRQPSKGTWRLEVDWAPSGDKVPFAVHLAAVSDPGPSRPAASGGGGGGTGAGGGGGSSPPGGGTLTPSLRCTLCVNALRGLVVAALVALAKGVTLPAALTAAIAKILGAGIAAGSVATLLKAIAGWAVGPACLWLCTKARLCP